jgi:hypothetical protein
MILQFAPASEMSFAGAIEVPDEKPVTRTKARVCKTCGLPIRPLALSKGWGHGVSLETLRRATARLGMAFVHDAVPAS